MKTRVLLVGFGFRGRQWLDAGRGVRKIAVRGIVDSDLEARAAAERTRLPVWSSVDEATAEPDRFDAAVIATPAETHVALTGSCLAAGLGVLVEKPLALTLREAADLAAAAESARRPLLVAQNFRFLPRERAVAKVLDDSRIGPVLSSVIESSRAPAAVRPSAGPVEQRALWDFALHHLDALRVRFGLPERIYAEISSFRVMAALNWAGGTYVDYRHDDGGAGYRYVERLEGTEGAATVDDQRVTVEQPGRRPRRVRTGRTRVPEQAVLEELARAVTGGRETALEAKDNLLTLAMVEAVILSARLRRPVTLAEVAERAEVPLPPGGVRSDAPVTPE